MRRQEALKYMCPDCGAQPGKLCIGKTRLRIATHRGRSNVDPEFRAPARRKRSKKDTIPRSLSKAVFERDAYRCVKCGTHVDLSCDHRHPESRGGKTTLENLQTMCRPCNSRKGAKIEGEGA